MLGDGHGRRERIERLEGEEREIVVHLEQIDDGHRMFVLKSATASFFRRRFWIATTMMDT